MKMFFDENNITFRTSNNTLFSYEEGFNKGNLFKNLYSKYKNHVYKLKVNNKKDELLYKIQMYYFSVKDLNLYLDVHPTDESMVNEYMNVKDKFNEAKEEYEREYGVLSAECVNTDNWSWINNPWPWDKGGN